MIVQRVELVDVRSYTRARFDFAPGTTAVLGPNGRGKTNLVESLALLATMESFRAPSVDTMVRVGADSGVVRAEVTGGDREFLIEIELSRQGRHRVLVNRQRLTRVRDLLGMIRVTVFTPDDLVIVKGSPGERRRFLDDTLVALAIKNDGMRLELERILRQRNTFLKQVGGSQRQRFDESAELTLDVWDAKLAEIGDRVGNARAALVARLSPYLTEAYTQLAGVETALEARYEPSWRHRGLATALAQAREEDLRRQLTTVGPHRDEIDFSLGGLATRTHASQGEQRTFALSLRLAAHRLVTERTGVAPLLILDDVLSELDPLRAAALLNHLPAGQVIITSASPLPEIASTDAVIRIDEAVMG